MFPFRKLLKKIGKEPQETVSERKSYKGSKTADSNEVNKPAEVEVKTTDFSQSDEVTHLLDNKEKAEIKNNGKSSVISELPSDSGVSRESVSSSVIMDSVSLPDPPSPTPILKKKHHGEFQEDENGEHLIDSLSVHLSALYAMLVVILGAVIPVSDPFTTSRRPYLFQGFYIYLFLGSVFFMLFMYFWILKSRACRGSCDDEQLNAGLSRKQLNRSFSFDDSPHSHTGSFYLRLGALAFGTGSMIMNGLAFGSYFESNLNHFCQEVIYGIRPVVHFIFTFGQLYFVFLHSKVCVQRYKIVSRFGFMHMIATNLCVWLGNIVDETLEEIHENAEEHEAVLHLTNHSEIKHSVPPAKETKTIHTYHSCRKDSLMSSVVDESSPYLYPCSIEYSLICAGIVYIMWKNIGSKGVTFDREEVLSAKAKAQRMNLDCTGSSRGLFLGIFVLIVAVINVITFFILVRSEKAGEKAMLLEYLFEIALFVVTSIAVIIAFYKMRSLEFIPGKSMDLEQNLIVLALVGIYIFSLLSIIAGSFVPGKIQSILIIVSSVLRMFQATIQTVFMLNSLRRCAHLREQERSKPGREFVTFLLIVNISMWMVNSFEVQQSEANPVQIDFYGILAWNIFAHLSSPLAIFYRFHSTVCLSNIWKHAWKRKRH